mgnify:CR=1 FL=1
MVNGRPRRFRWARALLQLSDEMAEMREQLRAMEAAVKAQRGASL